MARGTLAIQEVDLQDGLLSVTFTAVDAVDGHQASQKLGDVFFLVKTTGTATVATAPITKTVAGVTPAGKTFSFGSSVIGVIPVLPLDVYGQASNNVWLNFSSATGASVAAVRFKSSR